MGLRKVIWRKFGKKGQVVWSELSGWIKAILVLVLMLVILLLWYGSAEGAVEWFKNFVRFGR